MNEYKDCLKQCNYLVFLKTSITLTDRSTESFKAVRKRNRDKYPLKTILSCLVYNYASDKKDGDQKGEKKDIMLGAIIGDIVGSRFEWHNLKSKEFELFTSACKPTDDSVMTLAVAKAILQFRDGAENLSEAAVACMQELGRRYPHSGYGGAFRRWLQSENPLPYGSYGNGAAMRVSACGFAAQSLEEAIELAHTVTAVTHNHPEGFKGAEATAAAIYLAQNGKSKEEIRTYLQAQYYPLDFTLDEIRETYRFDVSCQGSVPQALEAFLESESFEDAIRAAISIGGDSDTIAAIAGGIAEAYYGVPDAIKEAALPYLPQDMREILGKFESEYPSRKIR